MMAAHQGNVVSARTAPALAMARRRGRNGVNEAVMLANRFQPRMHAHLNREGLTTAMIGEPREASRHAVELIGHPS